MVKASNLFGAFFRQERQRLGLSLWKVAVASSTHLRNIQRIESGERQPGVGVALRLVDALGIRHGLFFRNLVEQYPDDFPHSVSPLDRPKIIYSAPVVTAGMKNAYGPLLAQARTQAHVSQTAMAKAVGYNLRNISLVESGQQEPAIITSIALVMATGEDIERFFTQLNLSRASTQ